MVGPYVLVRMDIREEMSIRGTGGMESAERNNSIFHEATISRVDVGNADRAPMIPWMSMEVVHLERTRLTPTGESAKGSLGAGNGNTVVTVFVPPSLFHIEISADPWGAIGDTTVSGCFVRAWRAKGHVDPTL